jgi:hypothetical protein
LVPSLATVVTQIIGEQIMSLILTPIASDNFTRANESPLASPPWSTVTGFNSLQVVSNVCEPTTNATENGEEYTNVTLPANQYASATLGALTSNSAYFLHARCQSITSLKSCYRLTVNPVTGSSQAYIQSIDGSGNATLLLLLNSGLVISSGDVWSIACVGSSLFIVQNGTSLGNVTDTTYASGQYSGLGIRDVSTQSDTTVTNFTIGSAAISGGGGGNGSWLSVDLNNGLRGTQD